ncbi:hypothetical protein [Serratia oryzae]|uniref:Uncharacterized protein n=1 Tax=Serratia oryzae TaxID=2034155 RepID=A0A1S8CDW3_9GAMM|nr:hypothetical protein [Serratia oryzae]OMQ18784.1 hypothetical protein BMI79_21825 [Serratia oryzae]
MNKTDKERSIEVNESKKSVYKSSDIEKKKRKLQRDRDNKAAAQKKYSETGFTRTKIYLGRDVYERLADIYERQHGKPLNIEGRKDIDSLSRVISYCINRTYKFAYINKGEGTRDDILPARNARSQELYDLHQAAKFLKASGYSTAEIRRKLSTNGCPPPNILNSNQKRPWVDRDVEDLLNLETLNADLRDIN